VADYIINHMSRNLISGNFGTKNVKRLSSAAISGKSVAFELGQNETESAFQFFFTFQIRPEISVTDNECTANFSHYRELISYSLQFDVN